jgi:hypothetical protein
MRVIIRFSINRDHGSKMRNSLKAILEKHGIRWTGAKSAGKTGTYEGDDIDEADIQKALRLFWLKAQRIGITHLDHFWMYADKEPRKRVRLIED